MSYSPAEAFAHDGLTAIPDELITCRSAKLYKETMKKQFPEL